MASPGIDINLFDATVYSPTTSNAIMGVVGPATKGPVNRLSEFTDEGNFVRTHGQPLIDRMYAQRAGIRYTKQGNQLRFVRIAGSLLSYASVELLADDRLTTILDVVAFSQGTWANGGFIQVAIQRNADGTYNVLVYQQGQLVENHLNLDNGTVETVVNRDSSRIQVTLRGGVGNTPPRETVNPVTGTLDRVNLSGGDDGAFASTRSAESSTGPVAGKRFYGTQNPLAGSRTFEPIVPIDGTLAGLSIYYGSLNMPVVPGTVTIRVQTGAATFVELADSWPGAPDIEQAGLGVLEPAAGAHTGFIDYRTGRFGVSIDAATFFVGGLIDGIWVRGESEAVGAQVRGLGAYAGGLSLFPLAPGYFNAGKATFTLAVEESVGEVPLGAAGADNTDPLLKTLAGWIVPGTVILTPDHPTEPLPPPIYDDGFGGFRTAPDGGGVPVVGATIDYRTGEWAAPAWDPVGGVLFPAGTAGTILAEYDIQLTNQGGGAIPGSTGAWVADETVDTSAVGGASADDADPNAERIDGPIAPGTLRIDISDVGGLPFSAYDNGVGGWVSLQRGNPDAVAITGTIDYDTGAWDITPGAAIAIGAVIQVSYTRVVRDQAARFLRGNTQQLLGSGATLAAGLKQEDPTPDNLAGSDWLDHRDGSFAFDLNLVTTGIQTFDLADGQPIQATYAAVAALLGFGDGTTTAFVGQLAPAPFRREASRLRAFQAAQASLAGAGDAQIARSALGAAQGQDFWVDNVSASNDPDNFLSYGTGQTGIEWTGAPSRDEAVFVLAEDTVLHVTARYNGDIGNERPVLTDGLWCRLEEDPTLAGTLRFQVRFEALQVVESFGQAANLDELIAKVNDPDNGSNLVTLESTPRGASLTADTGSQQDIGMAGAFTNADVVGTKVGVTYTGLQHFRNPETVPLHFCMVPGQWHRQVISGLQELCERPGRRVIGIVPLPDADDPYDHRDFTNGIWNSGGGGSAVATPVVPFPPQTTINSSLLAFVAPWVTYFDAYANREVDEPAEGELGYLIARTDRVAAPWFPVAGYRRGLVNVSDIRYSAPKEDRDLLYGTAGGQTQVLNLIVEKVGRGLALFGQRTAQRNPSAIDRLNVRWAVNVIMNLIDFVSQEFLFELNDTILWREAEAALNSILAPIAERRGLIDASVVVDGTTTTADDIDTLKMNGKLFIKPARAVENIEYDLILTPTGADFSEVRIAG